MPGKSGGDMLSHEEMLERVLSRVSDKVAESVKQTVAEAVQKELSSTMTKVMVESEFYKQVNEEMRSGLKGIYQIANASTRDGEDAGQQASRQGADSGDTQKLFSDATQQIEEIMQTTLQATENIMEKAEQLLERQAEAAALIQKLKKDKKNGAAIETLEAFNEELAGSLTGIITDLSFQDLTGQRLKKVVSAIGSIRETVFDLYVSTGLMMKSREERPEADLHLIAEESRRKVKEIKNSELKGPVVDSSQEDVDDLLASLGL